MLNIKKYIIKLIKKNTNIINISKKRFNNLKIDSLDIIEIIIKIENKFNIKFNEKEIEYLKYKNINSFIKYIKNKL